MTHGYQPDKTRVPAGVAVIIKNTAGNTLGIKRIGAHGHGLWSVPGGWVSEADPDLETTAVREVWEEVGLNIQKQNVSFLGLTRDIHREGVHDVCLWYEVTSWDGTPRNANPDRIAELVWLDFTYVSAKTLSGLFLPLRNALTMRIVR